MINLIITGAPGSGKSTQVELLSKDSSFNTNKNQINFIPVNSGKLIYDEINSGTELGDLLNETLNNKETVSDPYVCQLVMNKVTNYGYPNGYPAGFLFDGFPRTKMQAEFIERLNIPTTNDGILALINLEIDSKSAIERLLNRAEKSTDMNNKSIKERLKKYIDYSKPVLNHFKDITINIDATGTIEQVNERIVNALTGKQE